MYFKNLDKQYIFVFLLFISSIFLFDLKSVFSTEYSSSGYKVQDPVMNAGGYGTSASFKLSGVISQISNGTSTSLSFGNNAGFLYFPFASSPSVSATPGSGQVALSWTASTGYLGWTTSGYNVGQSTVSGGPYSFTSFGNITSSTITGLTNGTTYYFVVVVKDVFGNPVATSTQVSATPVATVTPPGGGGSSGGGGGGGGGDTPTGTGVNLSGRAYPLSKVSFLKDGQLVLTTISGPDSNFSAKISNLSSGNYSFSVYSEDSKGIRSSSFTFPIYITTGVFTNIGGIFIAPTISVDKSEVKKGENIVIFGQSAPVSDIVINVNSAQEFFEKTNTDQNGVYLHNFDSSLLEMGKHSAMSKAATKGEISPFSNTVGFIVGTKNVLLTNEKKITKCDLNEDGRCNLIDFSIAAFWYKRQLTSEFIIREKKHLNGDAKLDLVDFSIMAYYWTG